MSCPSKFSGRLDSRIKCWGLHRGAEQHSRALCVVQQPGCALLGAAEAGLKDRLPSHMAAWPPDSAISTCQPSALLFLSGIW